MALPTYTLTTLQNAVLHAIGASATDSKTSATEIVNNALQYLCRQFTHARWRRKVKAIDFTAVAITSLVRATNVVTVTKAAHGLAVGDTVRITGASSGFDGVYIILTVPLSSTFTVSNAGSDETAATQGSYIPGHVNLPSDFEKMLSLAPSSQTIAWTQGHIDEINQLRQNSFAGFGYMYDIGYSPQASVTASPLARLELFPVPSAAATDVARMIYLRTIDNLANGTDVPDVPVHLHPVLKQICREFATSDEDQDDAKLIEGGRARQMLAEAIANAGMTTPTSGTLKSQLGRSSVSQAFPPQAMTFS